MIAAKIWSTSKRFWGRWGPKWNETWQAKELAQTGGPIALFICESRFQIEMGGDCEGFL